MYGFACMGLGIYSCSFIIADDNKKEVLLEIFCIF